MERDPDEDLEGPPPGWYPPKGVEVPLLDNQLYLASVFYFLADSWWNDKPEGLAAHIITAPRTFNSVVEIMRMIGGYDHTDEH